MGLYSLPRGAGSSAVWPSDGLGEAGDSTGWGGGLPEDNPVSLRKLVDTGLAQARRWGSWVSVGGPASVSMCYLPSGGSPTGDSACHPLQSGPGWSSEYGGCLGRAPCTCPDLVTVTSQPAPDQPRKPYCPCRLGSFLL